MQKTLSDPEVLDIIQLLEAAERNHCDWLQRVHVSIICHESFGDDALDPESHQRCTFGCWYYADVPELLRRRDEFRALEPLHREMHDAARRLADICIRHQSVRVDEYEDFIKKQRVFSTALNTLRDDLNELLHSFDALTGLMTRQPFAQILESEYARLDRSDTSSCMALMDIDHFKSINDNHGHLVGDRVLRHVAQFIRSHIRPYDSVCRYGGEEFLVIRPDTDVRKACDIVDRIRQRIAELKVAYDKNRELNVTLSAGIAPLRDDDEKTTIGKADQALYRAKSRGRNRVRRYDKMIDCEHL